jgi:hypothetical protein
LRPPGFEFHKRALGIFDCAHAFKFCFFDERKIFFELLDDGFALGIRPVESDGKLPAFLATSDFDPSTS